MTLLDPIAGVIAASISVPLLLLTYFLKLRRRPMRVSSTMLWQRAVRDLQGNVPFKWLRPSVLLLLQLLALACLVLAFARPAVDAAGPAPGRLIILLDASASMAAPSAERSDARGAAPEPTRLDEAKRLALDLIDRLGAASADGSASEAMVVSFAHEPRILAPFTSDRAALRAAVRGAAQTDQPGNLADALRLLAAQGAGAAEDDQRPARPAAVLFSDGAFPDDQRRPLVTPSDFTFVRTGPPPAAVRDNIGVAALSVRRDADDPALLRLFARLVSTSPQPLDVPVVVRAGGEPLLSRVVAVPGAGDGGPGEAAVTLELRSPPPGPLLLSIERRDALPADNDAGIVLDPPGALATLIVAPANEADPYIVRALEAFAAGPVRTVAAPDYERMAAGDNLADFGLFVFDRVRPGAPPPGPSISFGAGLPIPGLAVLDPEDGAAEGETPRAVRFLSWRRSHPVMRQAALDRVVLARPLRLVLPGQSDAPGGRVIAEPLAQGPDGPLIALLEQAGVRRLVVAFPLDRSTWALDVSFAIFMANAVEHLTSWGRGGGRAFTTTETVGVRPSRGAERLTATGPVDVSTRVRASAGVVPLGPLPRAGMYRVEGAMPEDALLAVNMVSAHESAIATADSVDVGAGRADSGGVGDTAPREVWEWFVLAGVLLLVLEWLLFAWRMRV